MKKQARAARRQRIPAFGEWNYGYGGDWAVTQYFDSAMHGGAGLIATPSPCKPVKKVVKWNDSGATLYVGDDEKPRQRKVVVGLVGDHDHDHGAAVLKKQGGKQSRVADAADCRGRVLVKAVDQDLYEIPPDMLCHKPSRKRLTKGRSVWLGCLGLSCMDA